MKIDKHGLMTKAKRTASILTAAFIVNAMLIATPNTYSWFTSQTESKAVVKAASTSDIFNMLGLADENSNIYNFAQDGADIEVLNPMYIIAQSNQAGPYTVFFEFNDPIKRYILHVNPIQVTSSSHSLASIDISLKPNDYNEIKNSLDQGKGKPAPEPIRGILTIKYLNNYVSKSIRVAFTKSFLFERDKATVTYLENKEAEIASLLAKIQELEMQNNELNDLVEGLEQENQLKDEAISGMKEELEKFSEQLEALLEEDSNVEKAIETEDEVINEEEKDNALLKEDETTNNTPVENPKTP